MQINKTATFSKQLRISCMVFVILLILSPLLLFNNTRLLAFSASTKIAWGYGAGTITCPNKLVFNNEQIQFQVNKSKAAGLGSNEQGTIKSSLISGFWKVGTLNMPHNTHINLGSISDLRLSSSSLGYSVIRDLSISFLRLAPLLKKAVSSILTTVVGLCSLITSQNTKNGILLFGAVLLDHFFAKSVTPSIPIATTG